ncbi:uncharacterized protein LOC144562623 [Carex rostrata]
MSTSTEMSSDEIQPLEEISTSKEMDEWVAEIGARHIPPGFSHATRSSMDIHLERRPSIFGNWQSWDDFGVSFLPETEKWQIFACMTHWYDINVRLYLLYLQKKEAVAWSYYHGVNKQFRAENSKRFIEYLMVNSCFLIFVMLSSSGEESRKVITDKVIDHPIGLTGRDINSSLKFISEDHLQIYKYLFTLKYQIPWVFVEAVYTEFSDLSKLCAIPIHKLARLFMRETEPIEHPSKVDGSTVPKGGFKHLVHIFHWSRQPDEKYVVDSTRWFNSFHIPSATKLQLSQIVFQKDMDTSIDVSYSDNKRVSAVMQLTPWFISPLKRVLYESLLRFETLYTDCEIPFMVHFACMACLLKTEADVQVLRESGVINSPTSFDDKDVLLFVQELKTFISRNHRLPNKLVTLEKNVMAHHKKSVYRVYGEFKKRYCSNPWIIISVIAGIILFILTFIQTVLSFIQTKYSVLSYKQQ